MYKVSVYDTPCIAWLKIQCIHLCCKFHAFSIIFLLVVSIANFKYRNIGKHASCRLPWEKLCNFHNFAANLVLHANFVHFPSQHLFSIAIFIHCSSNRISNIIYSPLIAWRISYKNTCCLSLSLINVRKPRINEYTWLSVHNLANNLSSSASNCVCSIMYTLVFKDYFPTVYNI